MGNKKAPLKFRRACQYHGKNLPISRTSSEKPSGNTYTYPYRSCG